MQGSLRAGRQAVHTPGKADLHAAWTAGGNRQPSRVSRKGRGTHAIPTAAGCPLSQRPSQAGQEDLQGNNHTGQAASIWAGRKPQGWQGASGRQQRGSPGQNLQGPGSTQPQHVLTALESHEHVPSSQATCVTGLGGPSWGWLRGRPVLSQGGVLGSRGRQAGAPCTQAPLSPPALPRPLPSPVLSKQGKDLVFLQASALSAHPGAQARNHGSPWTPHSLAAIA